MLTGFLSAHAGAAGQATAARALVNTVCLTPRGGKWPHHYRLAKGKARCDCTTTKLSWYCGCNRCVPLPVMCGGQHHLAVLQGTKLYVTWRNCAFSLEEVHAASHALPPMEAPSGTSLAFLAADHANGAKPSNELRKANALKISNGLWTWTMPQRIKHLLKRLIAQEANNSGTVTTLATCVLMRQY